MLRHFSRNNYFQIFELGNIFENFDQKVPKKVIFWQKIMFFFDFFGQNYQKYYLIQKFEKTVPRVVS